MAAKKNESTEILIHEVKRGAATYHILGNTPLIPRCLSQKARQELLMPSKRKTRADKEMTFKHDPLAEFRESALTISDDAFPTLIAMPAGAFKRAMASATIDTGGSSRAQIGRLTYIDEYNVAVYGKPKMLMSVVRSADMNRTPDVRTRVIMERWCCELTIRYAQPMLTERTVTQLLANAGIFIGVGDWRQEKGSGSMGLFGLAADDDAEFHLLRDNYGRSAQQLAMKDPEFFDDATQTLYEWYCEERDRRTDKPAEPKAKKGAK